MKIVAEPKEIPTIMTLMADASDARDYLDGWAEQHGGLPTVTDDPEEMWVMTVMGLVDSLEKLGLVER